MPLDNKNKWDSGTVNQGIKRRLKKMGEQADEEKRRKARERLVPKTKKRGLVG